MKEVSRVEPAIGQVIRQARHVQQLTLEDVANMVGITAGALSHIESGRRLPNASNAVRIAQVLGIPRETLLTMLDDEHSRRRRHTADTGGSRGDRDEPPYALSAPALHDFSPRTPAYSERPIEDLFEPTNPLPALEDGQTRRRDGRPPHTVGRVHAHHSALVGGHGRASCSARASRRLGLLIDPNTSRNAR